MSYWRHFSANMRVAGRCLVLSLFHATHAVIPCSITSHEYWRL